MAIHNIDHILGRVVEYEDIVNHTARYSTMYDPSFAQNELLDRADSFPRWTLQNGMSNIIWDVDKGMPPGLRSRAIRRLLDSSTLKSF